MTAVNPNIIQPQTESNPQAEVPLNHDHSLDVDGTTGITNPNVNLALLNAPYISNLSNDEIGPKRELSFSQTGAFNSVRGAINADGNGTTTIGGTTQAIARRDVAWSDESKAIRTISAMRHDIMAAGKSHNVAPEAIAAILYQELATKGADDLKQDEFARQIANTQPGSPERAALVQKANEDPSVSPNPFHLNQITRKTTLGDSQISVQGMVELFGGKWNSKTQSYERAYDQSGKPAKNYLPNVMSQDQFFRDPVGNSMRILTDSKLASTTIGAWAEKQIADRSGKVRDGGTQYPNFAQQNRDLHYVFLTGTYSSGGQFMSTFGQQWGRAYGLGKFDPAITADPMKYTDLRNDRGPSPGATAALERRDRINNLLNGADPNSIRLIDKPGIESVPYF